MNMNILSIIHYSDFYPYFEPNDGIDLEEEYEVPEDDNHFNYDYESENDFYLE